jgi:hypothetical protein
MITLKESIMSNLTISNELLMVGAKSELGPITKKWIEDYIKVSVDNADPNHPKFKELCAQYIKDVKRVLGVNIAIEIYDIPDLIMGVRSQVTWFGHQGTRWYRDKNLKIVSEDSVSLKKLIQVDLKTGKVTGSLANDLTYTMILSHQMLNGFGGFTVKENTASLLHEYGHIINGFMYLGDYVWLNYYLTEGIEVMLGRKKDRVELELYNDRWLRENVPADEYENFQANKTEENAKRVILSVAKKLPRHHLTENEITAKRREEQTADMFATRLGYGRDLATALHKLNKYHEEPSLVGSFWFGEMAKVFVTLLFLPFAVIGLMVYDPAGGDAYTQDGRYDDPMDRLVKIRRDLVAQLKRPGPLNKQGLVDDIDAIDSMIKEYSTNSSTFDGIINFFRPGVRKMRQNTKVEDDLESLMNNDLFLQAHKLSKL